MPTIIITAPVHDYLITTLQGKGYHCVYEPNIDYTQLYNLIPQAHGLVVTTRITVDAAMLQAATQLQWIGRLGSGMELVDVAYAQAHNIQCISTPEGNCNAVAEHVIGMLLNLTHNISKSNLELRAGEWNRMPNMGTEIKEKTIGIIGYGNTGGAVAKLLHSFGVQVIAYDKYKHNYTSKYVTECSLAYLQNEADIITLHVPLTSETKHLINDSFVQQLIHKPILINASRGQVVHTPALINALAQGKLSGAALDVLENEKLHTYTATEQAQLNWLLAQPNVLITPHIAGYSHQGFKGMAVVLLQKLGLI